MLQIIMLFLSQAQKCYKLYIFFVLGSINATNYSAFFVRFFSRRNLLFGVYAWVIVVVVVVVVVIVVVKFVGNNSKSMKQHMKMCEQV